jgi:hypothetical protein
MVPPNLKEDVKGLPAGPEQADFDLLPTPELGAKNGSWPPKRAADADPNEEAAEWNDRVP